MLFLLEYPRSRNKRNVQKASTDKSMNKKESRTGKKARDYQKKTKKKYAPTDKRRGSKDESYKKGATPKL